MKNKCKIFLLFAAAITSFYFYENVNAANFSVDGSTWTTETIAGDPTQPVGFRSPTARRGHSAVYSNYGGKNEMIFFGGWDGVKNNNDVWILDMDLNTWKKIIPDSGTDSPDIPEGDCYDEDFNIVPCEPADLPAFGPAARLQHTAVYDSALDKMIIFGGGQQAGGLFRDTWRLDDLHTSPVWRKRTHAPTFGNRGLTSATAVIDTAHTEMIVFGGLLSNGSVVGETMIFNYNTNTWRSIAASLSGTARYEHSAVFDGTNMIIFGGTNLIGRRNDVLVLRNVWATSGPWERTWENGNPISNDRPTKRVRMQSFYDSVNNQMLTYGGKDTTGDIDNFWVLNNANGNSPTWVQIFPVPSGEVVGRWDYAGVYNNYDKMMTYGGKGGGNLLIGVKKLQFETPPTPPTINSITSFCSANSDPDNTINWTDNSTNEVGFNVYRKTTSFAGSTNPSEGDLVTSYFFASPGVGNTILRTDTTPTTGTSYYYRVVAVTGTALVGIGPEFNFNGTANCGPTATTQTVSAVENIAKTITLTGTDFDGVSVTALTFNIIVNPTNGALGSLSAGADNNSNNITYTPNANFIGSDSFTFNVTDSGFGIGAPATVSITVNGANKTLTITSPTGGRISDTGISCGNDGTTSGTDCAETYAYNTSVTLTATPNTGAGYSAGNWSGDCGTGGTGTNCPLTMSANKSASATFTAPGLQTLTVTNTGSTATGEVTSSPAGISCGADCSENYVYGTLVTLTAIPSSGNTFSGWSGGGCSGTGACAVTMNAAKTVNAVFLFTAPGPKILTVTKSGTGTGIVTSSPVGIDCGIDCSGVYAHNTLVTLTASPTSGHTFTGWSGACAGTGSCTVTMDAAKTVNAEFTFISSTPTFTIAPPSTYLYEDYNTQQYEAYYDPDGPSGPLPEQNTIDNTLDNNDISWFAGAPGDTATASINPITRIARGLSVDFAPTGYTEISARYTDIMEIEANAELRIHSNPKLSVTKAGTGSGTVVSGETIPTINCGTRCASNYLYGTVVSLTATPAAGSIFAGWSGDADCSDSAVSMISTTGDSHESIPTASRNCTATFNLIGDYSVEVRGSGVGAGRATGGLESYSTDINCDISNGVVSGTCINSWTGDTSFTDVRITLVPSVNSGSLFGGWTGVICDEGNQMGNCTFLLDSNKTLTAQFDVEGVACNPALNNPTTPSNPYPSNGATGVGPTNNLNLDFADSTDADSACDSVTYDVYEKNELSDPWVLACGNALTSACNMDARLENHTYYWYVTAKDNAGNTNSGPPWSFTTGESPEFDFTISPVVPAVANPGDTKDYLLTIQPVGSPLNANVQLSYIMTSAGINSISSWDVGFRVYFSGLGCLFNVAPTYNIAPAGMDPAYVCFTVKPHPDFAEADRGETAIFDITALAAVNPVPETAQASLRLNQRPTVAVSANSVSGESPLSVTFTENNSSDPDDSPVFGPPGDQVALYLIEYENASPFSPDNCFSTSASIDCQNIIGSAGTDPALGWSHIYNQSSTAVYCVFDDLILSPSSIDFSKSAGCQTINITVNPPAGAAKTLTITKSGTGAGTVTGDPAGIAGDDIDCGTNCVADFNDGQVVSLTAIPNAGSTFTGWSNCSTQVASLLSVTMDANKTCDAEFTISGGGNTAPTANGQSITVLKSSVNNPIVLSAFDPDIGDTLTYSYTQPIGINAGTVSGTAPNVFYTPETGYVGSDSFTFTATDNNGASDTATITITIVNNEVNVAPIAEASIMVNGASYSFDNPLTVTQGSPVIITSFNADVDVNNDEMASNDPNGWNDPNFGVSASGECFWDTNFNGIKDTLINSPNSASDCNILGSFSVTFNTVGNNQIFEILKITDNPGLFGVSSVKVNVVPVGAAKTLTITKSGTGAGTVTGDPAGIAGDDIDCGTNCVADFNDGQVVSLTAIPNAGSTFTGWSNCSTQVASPLLVTMDANKTCDAEFTISGGGNTTPIAVAEISTDGINFSNQVTVNQNEAVTIYMRGNGSSDPDGWTSANGVSASGKCDWNIDLNPIFAVQLTNTNPASPSNCTTGVLNKTFADLPGIYTYDVLKITDNGLLESNIATVSVRVDPSGGGGSLIDLIISAGPAVNSGNLTEGETLTFNGTVKNQGIERANGSFDNTFKIDLNNDGTVDQTLPEIRINGGLNPNEETQIISGDWIASVGTHRIILCADEPDNSINESNESNNCNDTSGSIGVFTISPPCSNECAVSGGTYCSSATSYKTCGNFDADSCLELDPNPISCGLNETCVQNGDNATCELLPIITFSGSPSEIEIGESSTLTWNIINVDNDDCVASNSTGSPEFQGVQPASGSAVVSPIETTSYTLTCTNSVGIPVSETITIVILQAPPPVETLKILKDLFTSIF